MYRNNLQKNDRVFHVPTGRQAKVDKDPRETSRMVSIVFDGIHTPKYVDIREVRLMPDGRTPENVPPCDGDPDEEEKKYPTPARATTPQNTGDRQPADLLSTTRAELQRNKGEMAALEERFRVLKAENLKLGRVLEVLEAT